MSIKVGINPFDLTIEFLKQSVKIHTNLKSECYCIYHFFMILFIYIAFIFKERSLNSGIYDN